MGFESIDEPRRRRRTTIIARAIIVIATIATFFPLMHHEFGGWDDEQNITLNPQMHPPDWGAVGRYWIAPKYDLYSPVTWTTWALLARVGYQADAPTPEAQLNPYLFHTANLAIHIGSALVTFALMRRVLGGNALLATTVGALLFALHPVQVEPVAWISGLKDVLAGMLSIGAIVLFLDSKGNRRLYVAAMFVFALAMLSKPSAVVVPAIVILIEVLVRRASLHTSLVRFSPALVLSVTGAIIARIAQQAQHLPPVQVWKRPLIAFDAISFYLSKILWPLDLGVHYGRTPQSVLSLRGVEWFWFTPLIMVAVLLVTRSRIVVAACAIFLVGIAPVLGLIPFDFQEYSTVADHYLYLAMLGPAMFVAWLGTRSPRYAIGAIGFIAIFAALSFRQSLTWHDAISISRQAVRVNPDSTLWRDRLVRLLLTRANSYADQGDTERAIGDYLSVIARDPTNAIAMANCASVYAQLGRFAEAISLYEQALVVDPGLESARIGLARARSQQVPATSSTQPTAPR